MKKGIVFVFAVLLVWGASATADIPEGVDFHAIWSGAQNQGAWTIVHNQYQFDDPYWLEEHLDVFVDNQFVPDWTKKIWVEVEWISLSGKPAAAPEIQLIVEGVLKPLGSVTPTSNDMGWTWYWEVFPQPDNEIIRFPDTGYWQLGQSYDPAEPYYMGVGSVEIGTLCVPEPATMALLGLGGILLLRRRK